MELKEKDFVDVFETIYSKKSDKYFTEFIKLCCTFITLFKSKGFTEEQFTEMGNRSHLYDNDFIYRRNKLFLFIVRIIYVEYQKYLKENKSIDFSDMINEAAKQVQNGAEITKYKYIIVDEYQDISVSRFNLLKAIKLATNAKLLCVGDDWQSIYKFAGSDISLFYNFKKELEYSQILKIEKTYRNSQQLINEASAFIQKNTQQLQKQLKSDKQLNNPLVFWGYNQKVNQILNQVVEKIISEFGTEKSILFLGRTNYDLEILRNSGLFKIIKKGKEESLIYLPSPQTPVSFLSVHKSKGLEADNVIVINFKNEKLGFPNQIADDKVLNFVLTEDESYQFAEERRLFYVAITRTRNRTFVLTDIKQPSIFFRDFTQSESCCFININNKAAENTKCPRCFLGDLVKVEHEGNTFIGCTNFPRCSYTLNNLSVLANPKKCPSCGGFLVKRSGKGHWFLGCTNFPYCEYTQHI